MFRVCGQYSRSMIGCARLGIPAHAKLKNGKVHTTMNNGLPCFLLQKQGHNSTHRYAKSQMVFQIKC